MNGYLKANLNKIFIFFSSKIYFQTIENNKIKHLAIHK